MAELFEGELECAGECGARIRLVSRMKRDTHLGTFLSLAEALGWKTVGCKAKDGCVLRVLPGTCGTDLEGAMMEAAPWMREAAKDVIDKAKGVWLCGSDCLPCVQDVAQIIAKYAPPQPTLHECQCIILAPRSSKYCADCGGLVEANQVVAPQDTSSPDKCGQRFTCAATGLRIYTCALEKGHDGDCDDHPTRGLAAKEGWQNP